MITPHPERHTIRAKYFTDLKIRIKYNKSSSISQQKYISPLSKNKTFITLAKMKTSIEKLLNSVRQQVDDPQIIGEILDKLSDEKYRQVFQILDELKRSGKWIPNSDDEKNLEQFWWEHAN